MQRNSEKIATAEIAVTLNSIERNNKNRNTSKFLKPDANLLDVNVFSGRKCWRTCYNYIPPPAPTMPTMCKSVNVQSREERRREQCNRMDGEEANRECRQLASNCL